MSELTTSQQATRRDTLKRGLAAAGLLAFVPDWATPALAQGEVDVPFTDIPATFNPNNATTGVRMLDIRKIDGPFTSKDDFFTIQHMGKPEIDAATYKLKFTGMVNKPTEFTLADLKAMRSTELPAGYECSGNSPRSVQGLSSCGRFTGVRLSDVLKQVGVNAKLAKWFSSAPTTGRRKLSSARIHSKSSSSSGAASRWRTR